MIYDYIDRPVTDLRQAERFLLWSMRTWVTAMRARMCPTDALAPAFAKGRMLSGLQPFQRAMALFNRHGLESFGFCPLACQHVAEHEALLLGVIGGLRRGTPLGLRKTLDLLVEDEAVGPLIVCLSQLDQAMVAAGFHLGPAGSDQPDRGPRAPRD